MVKINCPHPPALQFILIIGGCTPKPLQGNLKDATTGGIDG
jgi:hypothetical protein